MGTVVRLRTGAGFTARAACPRYRGPAGALTDCPLLTTARAAAMYNSPAPR